MATVLLHPNLVTDKTFRDEVKDVVIPQVKDTRRDRRTLRETWLRYHRIWSATRDQEAYQGREALYFAKGRKIIDNWVRRLKRDLFPADDWFQVQALRDKYSERESPTHAILDYFARHDADLRRNASPWLRQLVTLGTSPVKVRWQQDEETLDVLREILDPDGNPTRRVEKIQETVIRKLGPTFEPVDLFSWYVTPVTVRDPDDAFLTFEDLLVPRGRVVARGEQWISPRDHDLGTVYDKDAVAEIKERMEGGGQTEATQEKWNAERRRLADKGFTATVDQLKVPVSQRPIDLTQIIWKRVDGKTGETTKYLVDVAMDDITLRIQRLPWTHGHRHILAGKFVEVVSEFYGRGLPEIFDRMQYTLNDTGNQALDALTYAVNPITVVDLYQVQDPTSLRFRPGAKWLAAPGSVKAFETSPEPAVVGLNAVGTLMQVMDDLANIVPIGGAGPKARGRGQQSSAGMQLAISEAQVDVRDVVENLEDQVMNHWLEMGHSLTIQYLEEPLILRIGGQPGKFVVEQKIDRMDLLGDFRFQWLGSSASMNSQVRASQMTQFLQIAGGVAEQVKAEGKMIHVSTILKAIWSQGMALPNADGIVTDIHPTEGTDPTLENDLFRVGRGRDVFVSEADDDDAHMQKHMRLAQQAVEADVPATDMPLLTQHIRRHQAAKVAKQILAQQQQQQQALQQASTTGKPNGQAGPQMNPGRPASTTSLSDVMKQAPRGQG